MASRKRNTRLQGSAQDHTAAVGHKTVHGVCQGKEFVGHLSLHLHHSVSLCTTPNPRAFYCASRGNGTKILSVRSTHARVASISQAARAHRTRAGCGTGG